MRKSLLTLALGFFLNHAGAQTLFTVGGEPVSISDFKQAFFKNNPEDTANAAAMQDYLELFIRYKLKIKAAYAAGIDTLPSQRSEAAQFRNQIAEPYMLDEATLRKLALEAAERSRQEVQVEQIFIPFGKGNNGTDSAEQQINKAWAQLKKGTPFSSVAKEYHAEETRIIGWITAFTLPYKPETEIYKLKNGAFSAPLKSSSGFHIFKRMASREARGSMATAHILIGFPPSPTAEDSLRTKHRADSVYRLLRNGAIFPELARTVSDDNATYLQGGELPPFATGELDPRFEKAAFSLAEDGAISAPVLTDYGYHLIKRLKAVPVPASTDPAFLETMRPKIIQDERAEMAREALVEMVLKNPGSRLMVKEKELIAFTEKNMRTDTIVPYQGITASSAILKTGEKILNAAEWMRYARVAAQPLNESAAKPIPALLEDLRRYEAFQHYRNHLEVYQPAFAAQYREFLEGNMLFEIMQRAVWNKASEDTAGLKSFFEKNKEKYYWNPAAEAVLFTCSDRMAANELKAKLPKSPENWQSIADNMDGRVFADSAKLELGMLPVSTEPVREKQFTAQELQSDGTILTAYIFKLYPEKHPRSFEEARGFVLNDYQQFLEEKWMEELKKKYPVEKNEAVIQALSPHYK